MEAKCKQLELHTLAFTTPIREKVLECKPKLKEWIENWLINADFNESNFNGFMPSYSFSKNQCATGWLETTIPGELHSHITNKIHNFFDNYNGFGARRNRCAFFLVVELVSCICDELKQQYGFEFMVENMGSTEIKLHARYVFKIKEPESKKEENLIDL